MTDRAELAKAAEELLREFDALPSQPASDQSIWGLTVCMAYALRQAAAALSAGEGGAWSLPKFFREEEPSFGFEADTESMSPEQAAVTLMRRLRREVNELRNPQPRKDGEAT